MKIKKLEKLQDLIDKDLAWRKKELIDLKLMIHSSNNPTLCRAGIALLSAHFEGFIKQVANYYVVHVSSQGIKTSELNTNFAAIQFGQYFERCGDSEKISVCREAIDKFIINYATYNFHIDYTPDNPIIKTESNPSSTVVKNIVDGIGLDFSPYETKRNFIDTDLLSNRHKIVHGEKTQISVGDFDSTFTNITEIMELFADQVIDAAINTSYKKPT